MAWERKVLLLKGQTRDKEETRTVTTCGNNSDSSKHKDAGGAHSLMEEWP